MGGIGPVTLSETIKAEETGSSETNSLRPDGIFTKQDTVGVVKAENTHIQGRVGDQKGFDVFL